jgi:hypothetical protein
MSETIPLLRFPISELDTASFAGRAQELEVKRVARDLLEKLQEQLAIADWRSKQQTRAAVETTIRFTLNELPEEPYPEMADGYLPAR